MAQALLQQGSGIELNGSKADRSHVRTVLREAGVLPALRTASVEDALFATECLGDAGLPIVEIASGTPGADRVISEVTKRFAQAIVGAGNVSSSADARACIEAGARFVSTAALIPEINELCAKHNVAVVSGAFTPTEIFAAWNAGADMVKVFPCDAAGGAPYIRSLTSALPEVPILAAGGVTQQTAFGLIAAGATAVAVGQALASQEAIRTRNRNQIQELARRFLAHVDNGRIEAAGRDR